MGTDGTARAEGPEPGGDARVLAGRYRLEGQLGRGGMSVVWRATDQLLGRQVAVKELSVDTGDALSADELVTARERTLREARALAQLGHPHIIGVHDVVEVDDRPYIVMELVDGSTLAERIAGTGPVAPREAARIGVALLGALRRAHASGVLHRDLKPANVLLEKDTGRVVLTDFGIARVTGATTLTEAGSFLGSPEFTAPERMAGARTGPASDLWSLGVLLCTAVSGVSPFHRDSLSGVLAAVVSDEIRMPSQAAPILPVISGLLERDPELRLDAQTAEWMLREYAETGRVPQPPRGAAASGAGRVRRGPLPARLRPTQRLRGQPAVPGEGARSAAGDSAAAAQRPRMRRLPYRSTRRGGPRAPRTPEQLDRQEALERQEGREQWEREGWEQRERRRGQEERERQEGRGEWGERRAGDHTFAAQDRVPAAPHLPHPRDRADEPSGHAPAEATTGVQGDVPGETQAPGRSGGAPGVGDHRPTGAPGRPAADDTGRPAGSGTGGAPAGGAGRFPGGRGDRGSGGEAGRIAEDGATPAGRPSGEGGRGPGAGVGPGAPVRTGPWPPAEAEPWSSSGGAPAGRRRPVPTGSRPPSPGVLQGPVGPGPRVRDGAGAVAPGRGMPGRGVPSGPAVGPGDWAPSEPKRRSRTMTVVALLVAALVGAVLSAAALLLHGDGVGHGTPASSAPATSPAHPHPPSYPSRPSGSSRPSRPSTTTTTTTTTTQGPTNTAASSPPAPPP